MEDVMSAAEEKERAEELYDKFFLPDHPELGTGPLSVEPYVSSEHFEKEREKIFKNSWIMVCHESEIPEPGNYLVRDVEFWNASVIVARSKDGKVRVLHNVCPHRANQLFYEPCKGKASAFTCQFHSWTFNLDGSCRAINEPNLFSDVNKADYGLKEVTSDTWRNFVFMHAQEEPEQSLREYLGTWADDLETLPFEKCVPAAHWSCVVKANWKTLISAFQEGYHFSTVHSTVAPTLMRGIKGPATHVTSFRIHGIHHAFTVPKYPDFVPSPTEALAFELASAGLSQKAGSFNEEWAGVNPDNIPYFGVNFNRCFPIHGIDAGEGWYYIFEAWPISVNETRFTIKTFLEAPENWGQRVGQELALIQIREALLEDLSTIEATQRGMESGAIKEIVLCDQELLVRHYYETAKKIAESR